ncbi:MAG TPA: metallophosphatase domain-containing protein [Flavisolibacter sp.]|nr:metallophosphatase domain-containing protein [Flavisolibacter sp.]
MKFVVLADTHSRHRGVKLPKGDVLIHAGDISYRGEKLEVEDFLSWFGKQDFEHKIFIAGNHDFLFEKIKEKDLIKLIPDGIIYLNDSGTSIHGINIWGSPITPKFFNWAFNRTRGGEIQKHWTQIPSDTDLLITHGPPFGILDQTGNDRHVGCKDLLNTIQEINPQVHVFGHIHESYGTTKNFGIKFINASLTNDSFELMNKPIVFVL